MDTFSILNTASTLVFGKSGQLAESFRELLPSATFMSSKEVNLLEPKRGAQTIMQLKPELVINCTAYTAVDRAEQDEGNAKLLNTGAPYFMAQACRELGVPFVHYSTDYVFAGDKLDGGYSEEDPTGPLGAYGRTKLEGEKAIMSVGGENYILRTSWVFSPFGHNFVKTMLRLGSEREELSVVADQKGCPTYAPHLAQATLNMIKARSGNKGDAGVYHLTGQGPTSWFEFATEIFRLAKQYELPLKIKNLRPIKTAEYPTPARRPQNSVLDSSKIRMNLGVELPPWQQGLEDFFKRTYGNSKL